MKENVKRSLQGMFENEGIDTDDLEVLVKEDTDEDWDEPWPEN